MISQHCIEKVKDAAAIEEVVKSYVPELKKHGSSWTARCPFHDEKSASFSVTPSRDMYHCFGCGKTGDAIQFVRDIDNKDFSEAVEILAGMFHIPIEYDKNAKKEIPEIKKKRAELSTIVKEAAIAFNLLLFSLPITAEPVRELRENRLLTEDIISQFMLGYAPESWDFIKKEVSKSGNLERAVEVGLLKAKDIEGGDKKYYDAFRNRIMFPIQNEKGDIIAFGGRAVGALVDAKGHEIAKYINSPESRIYVKSNVLYGLYQAQKAIRKAGKAYLVEGYVDVIAFHQAGVQNTVAPCGTALTDEQAKLLKKYTDHVVLVYDGDKSGQKAAIRSIDILLQHGFKVDVIKLAEEEDPDTFARQFYELEGRIELQSETDNPKSEIRAPFQVTLDDLAADAIEFKVDALMLPATGDIHLRDKAINEIALMLSLIPNDFKRSEYINAIGKKGNGHSIDKKILEKLIIQKQQAKEKLAASSKDISDNVSLKLPEGIDKDEWANNGWYPLLDNLNNTGYYFHIGHGHHQRIGNFILTPLYHSKGMFANERIVEVTNGITKSVIAIPSADMNSLERFKGHLFSADNYVAEGMTAGHFQRLQRYWGSKFISCKPISYLGWQRQGFFAFSNAIFDGEKVINYDQYGIVEFNGKNYLSESANKLTEELDDDEENTYKNDRYLRYVESKINFEQWAKQFVTVYGQNGWMGVAFVIVTIFKDVILESTKVPLLYAYGTVGSGKSEYGESLSNFFFSGKDSDGHLYKPFNLNQGTDYAFFARLERFRNCINAMNEFDESKISEAWFRVIKSIYDNEGREKGMGGSKNKTTSQQINCTGVLMGQILSTKDDNSVLSRCIPIPIHPKESRTEEETNNFRTLKAWERSGLSSIMVEMLKHRKTVETQYSSVYAEVTKRLSDEFAAEGKVTKQRMLKNVATTIAMVKLMHDKLKFPFEYEDFYQDGKRIILFFSTMIGESNSLAEFWNTVEFLLDIGEITEGSDFKIETHNSIKVGRNDSEFVRQFEKPTKLLFIRIPNIHMMYLKQGRQKTGNTGLNLQTLVHFLRDQDYFVGQHKSGRFRDKNDKSFTSSSYVLEYDKIGINIERLDDVPEKEVITIRGKVDSEVKLKDTGGIVKGIFMLITDDSYTTENLKKVEKLVHTRCYGALEDESKFVIGQEYEITGDLTLNNWKGREYRNLDITSWKLIEETPSDTSESIQKDLPF